MPRQQSGTALDILFFFTLYAMGTTIAQGAIRASVPITQNLSGPKSSYTDLLIHLSQNWRNQTLEEIPPGEHRPVILRCFSTPQDEFYIGVQGTMKVNAPLSKVESIVSNIDDYSHLFPGYKDIHVVSKRNNEWVTRWEQEIPVFFIPNVHFDLTYLVDHSPGRVAYRFQLLKSDKLTNSDGLIVLEDRGDGTTLYSELDFWNADYGILKTLAPSRIWRESIEAVYLSDLAFKLKAEHSEWTYEQIKRRSRELMETYPPKDAIAKREPFVISKPRLLQ